VRRAGWHRPDLALLSPPPVETRPCGRITPRAAATEDCSPVAAAPWRSESNYCKRRIETCFRVSREAPARHRETAALACDRSTFQRSGSQTWASMRLWGRRSKPGLFGEAGLVNRPSYECCEHRRPGVGRARTVMPHGGSDERFVREPVPPGPEALFTFGRGPVAASRRRLAAELAVRCRSLLDGSALVGGALCCLSSQSKRVHEPHSHALGRPVTPLARWCRNRGNTSLRDPLRSR